MLTSTITRVKPQWMIARSHSNGVASMPVSRITLPTLIVSHREDRCEFSPAADMPKLTKALTKAKIETLVLDGGKPPQSEACEAKAPNGYWGIEEKAVRAIARFVKGGGA